MYVLPYACQQLQCRCCQSMLSKQLEPVVDLLRCLTGHLSAGHVSSTSLEQLSQTRLIQQQQQQQQHLFAGSSQPPAGASYLAPSSSSYLAGSRFGANGSAGIHLPLGVSHLDPDGYLTNPSQSGLGNPIQTGMGHPGQVGSGAPQHSGLGNPVQTGMGSGVNPGQSSGLYQRPSSAQPLSSRQSMQVQFEHLHVRDTPPTCIL